MQQPFCPAAVDLCFGPPLLLWRVDSLLYTAWRTPLASIRPWISAWRFVLRESKLVLTQAQSAFRFSWRKTQNTSGRLAVVVWWWGGEKWTEKRSWSHPRGNQVHGSVVQLKVPKTKKKYEEIKGRELSRPSRPVLVLFCCCLLISLHGTADRATESSRV